MKFTILLKSEGNSSLSLHPTICISLLLDTQNLAV
jgi:hypothetical protein